MDTFAPGIPGVSDSAARRYRIMSFDLDGRASILIQYDQSDTETKKVWEELRAQVVTGLAAQFGPHNLEQKVADFTDMGIKPLSIIAHHNALFSQVRDAFTCGSYYAALTSACALGERILNHLVIDLRHHHKDSPHYKRVYRKDSFDDWGSAVTWLSDWGVLLPDAAASFIELKDIRHRSLHFNLDTANNLRPDALYAIGYLSTIIGQQFSAFGPQPWFMQTPGASFIKKEWETNHFIRAYYLPQARFVGPYHTVASPGSGFALIDHPDYEALGIKALSDEEYETLFADHPAEVAAKAPPQDYLAELVSRSPV